MDPDNHRASPRRSAPGDNGNGNGTRGMIVGQSIEGISDTQPF